MTAETRTVVLASASPRRRELLCRLGIEPVVVHPDIDESALDDESAVDHVRRLALAKAAAVVGPVLDAVLGPAVATDAIVIAADTVVVVDGQIIGKPADADDARRTLRALANRSHEVVTGVCVRGPQLLEATATTTVWFRPVEDDEIEWYVGTGEPLDKAGSYAIQGGAAAFVDRIEGSDTNVVGLPLALVAALLRDLGWRPPAG